MVILNRVGLKQGNTLVDVGCGEGFFAIPAARIVGIEGKVYGLDVNSAAIMVLKEKARREGFNNIILKLAAAEEAILCENCADIVLMANNLHDFEDPKKALANARKMLKPDGRLVDVDWKKETMVLPGPPMKIRLSLEEATKLIQTQGFKVEAGEDAGPYHYLIFAKP